jgi:protein required for attachment to host cells
MPKEIIYRIIVADGSEARIFYRSNKFGDLLQVSHLSHTRESTHEHGPDKPGRCFESANPKQHAYKPRTDWHEHQKEIFLKDLVSLTHQSYTQQEFGELIVVCPPHLLSVFRKGLSDYLSDDKIKEVNKDWTHFPKEEIQEKLKELRI